ncbi:MAG: hypothetical protein SH868_14950 [Bythopirellula sp.]|nr:hypothetical protein [Bythopirellula sp.]
MNSIWLSLLWKEWCEHRWKMAALTGILLATPALSLFVVARASRTDLIESALSISTTVLYPYALLAGMFIGMSVAAGENSRRTSRFLSAMPEAAWKAGAAKILVAMLVVSLPVVILWSLTWLFVSNQASDSFEQAIVQNSQEFKLPWSISNVFFARCVGGALGVVSVLLWCVVCGMNRADEVRAGALAFLGGSVAWLVFAGLVAIGRMSLR